MDLSLVKASPDPGIIRLQSGLTFICCSLSNTFPPPLPVAAGADAGAGRVIADCIRAVITMQNMKRRLTIGSLPRLFSSASASRIPTSRLNPSSFMSLPLLHN